MDILDETIPHTDISVLQIITAIITLIVGLIVIKIILKLLRKSMEKSKMPELIVEFINRLIGALLKIVIILLVASTLGFNTDAVVISFSAIFGLILAFGMQDSLNNFFAGIWIAALRPINKNEFVTIKGNTGHVSAVGMMATELLTKDNVFITIPNRLVWGEPVINFTRMPTRRVDIDVGISYGTSIDKAIHIAMKVMKKHPLVLDSPEPSVVMMELGDSAINLQLRPWTKTEDYWTVDDEILQNVVETYEKEGITIPFPQLDVHMVQE